MKEKLKVALIIFPAILAGCFMLLMLIFQIGYRDFGIVTPLTILAHEEVMLPIYVLFVGAMLSILLCVVMGGKSKRGR